MLVLATTNQCHDCVAALHQKNENQLFQLLVRLNRVYAENFFGSRLMRDAEKKLLAIVQDYNSNNRNYGELKLFNGKPKATEFRAPNTQSPSACR